MKQINNCSEKNFNEEFDKYIDKPELSRRTTFSASTINNLITAGNNYPDDDSVKRFLQGVHYIKPLNRVLFIWPAIEEWMLEESRKSERNKRLGKAINKIKD